jgi:outer membrane protein TolC
MRQFPLTMKLAGLCFALAWVTGTVTAQNQATNTRALSLHESIELALKHNLDVQIERYNPQLALYTLNAYYGGYEPALNLLGQHDHNEDVDRLLSGGFSIPGSISDDNSFSSSVSGPGPLPWGMTYSLQASVSDAYGQSFASTTNGLVSAPFESSVGRASVRVTQPLLKNLWIDSTRLNISVGKNRLKYSELGLKQRIINTVTSTEQAYYELIYSREFVKVQQKAVELAARLVEENKKRVEVGAMAPLDEKQAESQAAASRADLLAAQNSLAIQEHVLKNLLTDRYSQMAGETLVPSESLEAPRQSFNLQYSWSTGLAERPDLLQAKLDLERAGIQLKFSRNQLLPELDVFGTYGFNGGGKEFSGVFGNIERTDRPFYTYGGQVTIPLGNTTARNNFKYSRTAEDQAKLALKRLEQQAMVQIDDAIKQAQSSFERVSATRQAGDYAELALEAEQKKLESGKSTSFQVLQLQKDLTTARGNQIRALADYNKALSQLSLTEGTTLDRRGIHVDMK